MGGHCPSASGGFCRGHGPQHLGGLLAVSGHQLLLSLCSPQREAACPGRPRQWRGLACVEAAAPWLCLMPVRPQLQEVTGRQSPGTLWGLWSPRRGQGLAAKAPAGFCCSPGGPGHQGGSRGQLRGVCNGHWPPHGSGPRVGLALAQLGAWAVLQSTCTLTWAWGVLAWPGLGAECHAAGQAGPSSGCCCLCLPWFHSCHCKMCWPGHDP